MHLKCSRYKLQSEDTSGGLVLGTPSQFWTSESVWQGQSNRQPSKWRIRSHAPIQHNKGAEFVGLAHSNEVEAFDIIRRTSTGIEGMTVTVRASNLRGGYAKWTSWKCSQGLVCQAKQNYIRESISSYIMTWDRCNVSNLTGDDGFLWRKK